MIYGENTLFILACSATGGVNLFTSFHSFFRTVEPFNTLTRMVIIRLIWAIRESGTTRSLLLLLAVCQSVHHDYVS